MEAPARPKETVPETYKVQTSCNITPTKGYSPWAKKVMLTTTKKGNIGTSV